MMTTCRVCEQPTARATPYCRLHLTEVMDRLREEMSKPGKPPGQLTFAAPVTTRQIEPTKPKIERLPRKVRAARIARAARAAEGRWLSRDKAAEAAGVSPGGGLPRIIDYGTNAGWLVTKVPKPGVWAGPVAPPAEPEVSRAA